MKKQYDDRLTRSRKQVGRGIYRGRRRKQQTLRPADAVKRTLEM